MKTKWAVACSAVLAVLLAVFLGGCAAAKSQFREFSKIDVGGGPGDTLIRLTELQKEAPSTQTGNGGSRKTPQPVAGTPSSEKPSPNVPDMMAGSSNLGTSREISPGPSSERRSADGKGNPRTAPVEASPVLPYMTSLPEPGTSPASTSTISREFSSPSFPVSEYSSGADSRYRLGPEDLIHVSVWGNPELTLDVVVRPDGKVSIPLVQDIQAEGLTAGELAAVIHQRLLLYIKDPSVSVIVKQVNSSKFYIVGYVNKPGTYPLRGEVSVLQAISLAGGFTPFASPKKMRLVRNTGGIQEVRMVNYYDIIDKGGEGNYLLKPGDTIVVP